MPRFIHTADWQIGKQFGQFDQGEAAALSEQRIETVANIGHLARDRGADAILVAGDVFDVQAISSRTFHRLTAAMASYGGPWVLLPGNHDAALSESVWQQWQRTLTLPDNIHLALEPGVLELPGAGLAVFCAPLTQRHSQRDLTEPFGHWTCSDGLVRVGLGHGSVQGILPDQVETQNPIDPDRAALAGLDYLALGDWHGYLQINPRTAYSGTPETDVFRNNDSGNVLEVTVEQPGATPAITRRRLSRYRWREDRARLLVPEDLARVQEQFDDVDRSTVLKLQLEGTVDLATHQQVRQWLAALEARVHVLQLDDAGLNLAPNDADLAELQADGYLAEVIDELSEEQERDEVSREALRLLLQKLVQHRQEAPR